MFEFRHFSFMLTEHDPAKPWLVVGPLRRMSVALDDGEDFRAWAAQA